MVEKLKNPFGASVQVEPKKEEVKVVEPEVKQEDLHLVLPDAVVSLNNMTISSPKKLWDVLGCVTLTFQWSSLEDAAENVQQAYNLWSGLGEMFSEELKAAEAVANLASDAQKFLIEKLYKQAGKEVPENLDKINKSEASELIDAISKADRPASAPAQQAPNRWQGNGGGGGGSKPASEKQLAFIRTLVNRLHCDYPENMNNLTAAEASAWLDAHMGSKKESR